jgi:hypothetical protein
VLLVLACASPPPEVDLEELLRHEAESVSELSPGYRVVALEADSKMDALSQVVRARADGPSEFSRFLARAMEKGERKPAQFVIGGFYPSLNQRVLLDTLVEVRAPRLPGLLLVYVSPEPPSEELLIHRPFTR